MPLRANPFGPAAVEPWLAGLLPEDEAVLRAWGLRFQVSRRNVFDLLAEVGEDCGGAVARGVLDTLPAVVAGALEGPGDDRVIERLAERVTNRAEAALSRLRD